MKYWSLLLLPGLWGFCLVLNRVGARVRGWAGCEGIHFEETRPQAQLIQGAGVHVAFEVAWGCLGHAWAHLSSPIADRSPPLPCSLGAALRDNLFSAAQPRAVPRSYVPPVGDISLSHDSLMGSSQNPSEVGAEKSRHWPPFCRLSPWGCGFRPGGWL